MSDIWGFLLQTLTASGVAVLLVVIKDLFRDKLPPKWHFAIWAVLGVILLIPAGIGGRYVLFNWPLAVETLKSTLSGVYTYTHVTLPIPLFPASVSGSVWDWLFVIYWAGVVLHLMAYALSYVRLRLALREGVGPGPESSARIAALAAKLGVRGFRTVEVPGLPSAFVCGVLRPILVLPAGDDTDDKVLLHELLHLKSRDTFWTMVICLLRSIHWCNPLLVWCAGRAGNDLEARCDQRVLERLEGEDRRDYGRILLGMSNQRYPRTPGSTCVSNGGKNIRRRIEAIARFKRYPAGMELVAACAGIILTVSLALGAQATEVYDLNGRVSPQTALASARAVHCTTPAGAFDTYGKSILCQNGIYRAMCTPEDQQAALAEALIERYEKSYYPNWDIGIGSWPNTEAGYRIYNLRQTSDTAYEGLLVFKLNYRPDGMAGEYGAMILAYQALRVQREGDRWVAIPLEDFRWIETTQGNLDWGCADLPGAAYSGTASDFRVDVTMQTIYTVDSTVYQESDISWLIGGTVGYPVPNPHAQFDVARQVQSLRCTHLGSQAERDAIRNISVSMAPVEEKENRPVLEAPHAGDASGSSSNGASWSGRSLEGGRSVPADMTDTDLPAYFAVDLYINGERAAEMELARQEGGT